MSVPKSPVPPAFLFPGQGAFLESVFGELAARRPEFGEVFGEVDAAVREAGLRGPVSPQLFTERPPSLEELLRDDPDLLQLALFGTSVAAGHVLLSEGCEPFALVGHSLGEIAALTVGGALSLRDGALVVARRSAALRAAAGRGGLLALGAGARRVSALVELLGDPWVVVAVENGPRQAVVSGPDEQLQVITEIADRLGIPATRLRSPHPFHGPLVAEASETFHRSIRGVRQAPLRAPVFSPICGRYYSDGDDLAATLASHLTRPVRFLDGLRELHGAGVDVFVECGARDALSSIAAASLPDVTTIPCLVEPSPVDSLRGALGRLTGGGAELRAVPDEPVRSGLERGAVIADLRGLYAAAVEYPVEVFAEDVDLEADLGVDSVKQTELLSRVAHRYGLPDRSEGFRVADHPTLGHVADLVLAHGSAAPAAVA